MLSPQAVVALFLRPLGTLVTCALNHGEFFELPSPAFSYVESEGAEFQHAAASGRNSLFPWSTPGYLRVFACLDSRVLGHRRHF